jgi:hypothetical protein
MIEELAARAERADRAMRTFRARTTAETVYELVRDAVEAGPPEEAESRILAILAAQRGWSRRSDRELACSFGERTSVLSIPRPFDTEQLARLITRTEVNVFLGGGADDALMRELQSLAARELQRLMDAGTRPGA